MSRERSTTLAPVSALTGMNAMSWTSSRAAKLRNSASIARNRSSLQSTRSILLTANTRCGMRNSDAMNAWRRLCSTMPWGGAARVVERPRGAAALLDHALAGVDQDDRQARCRRAGDHVARVLDVARGVGDDELAPPGSRR